MTTSDQDALLRAIIAHSDEDTPRLVYADWLEENGDPGRAEFIRASIETEVATLGSPEHCAAVQKMWENRPANYAVLRSFDTHLPEESQAYERGLPFSMHGNLELHDNQLSDAALRSTLASTDAADFHQIWFYNEWPATALQTVIDSQSNLPKLRVLMAQMDIVDDVASEEEQACREAFTHFCQSPLLGQLHSFGIEFLTTGMLRELVESPQAKNLRRLYVGYSDIDTDTGALVNSPNLTHLQQLDFDFSNLEERSMRRVLGMTAKGKPALHQPQYGESIQALNLSASQGDFYAYSHDCLRQVARYLFTPDKKTGALPLPNLQMLDMRNRECDLNLVWQVGALRREIGAGRMTSQDVINGFDEQFEAMEMYPPGSHINVNELINIMPHVQR